MRHHQFSLTMRVDLRGQRRHLVHALLPGRAGAVCPVGQLIGVVAETRHLAQQVGMVSTGARMKFAAHDQTSNIRLAGQAAQVRLPVKVA